MYDLIFLSRKEITMYDMLKNCRICPKKCGTDRYEGSGFCGAGAEVLVSKAYLHQWEEPCISGTRGSGTVFFSGCNMKCVFCQNHYISQMSSGTLIGKRISAGRLADIFLQLQDQGAHNINLVSPTPYAPHIIEAVGKAKKNGLSVPIIYNTNGYELEEMIEALKGTVDVYLPDIKYYDDLYSEKYSSAVNYFKHASKAIKAMHDQVGYPEFDENGMIKKGLIIRHLVLPGLGQDSKRIFQWIRENIGKYAYMSIMCQYIPMYKAFQYKEINRKISSAEYDEVLDYFLEAGLENGFMQDIESADSSYVPDFDFFGA
jgi:putative pyruvate formate lyase activating enzyme